jgi:hypothetical protein
MLMKNCYVQRDEMMIYRFVRDGTVAQKEPRRVVAACLSFLVGCDVVTEIRARPSAQLLEFF